VYRTWRSAFCGAPSEAIQSLFPVVMPGLEPGIHVFASARKKDVDGRGKPGHDDVETLAPKAICDPPPGEDEVERSFAAIASR
jgi:hypothetical protein